MVTTQTSAVDIVERLRAMYSHRGDGIPTQHVNLDAPEAAAKIEILQRMIDEAVNALEMAQERMRCFDRWHPVHFGAEIDTDYCWPGCFGRSV